MPGCMRASLSVILAYPGNRTAAIALGELFASFEQMTPFQTFQRNVAFRPVADVS
jgi:hypothetical protein